MKAGLLWRTKPTKSSVFKSPAIRATSRNPNTGANFASLPRELRDKIYNYCLNLRPGGHSWEYWLADVEDGQDYYLRRLLASGLFSTRASTAELAAEAREAFYHINAITNTISIEDLREYLTDPI